MLLSGNIKFIFNEFAKTTSKYQHAYANFASEVLHGSAHQERFGI